MMSEFVLMLLAWSMPFLMVHCVWCLIAGNIRLAAAELIMGMVGNAAVCGLFLQLVGDPVPMSELFRAQFAGIAMSLQLVQSLSGQS